MKHFKHYTIIGIIFVLLTGTLSHFLYKWSGNNFIVGLFTPVNESVWEHMKMLFFPMLLYALFIIFRFKGTNACVTSSLCFGILAGTFLIPVFFYAYTSILGKDIFILDICTFILSVLIAFLLSYRLALSCRAESCTFLLCCLACMLFLCFAWFTYHPPDARIFKDPANESSVSQQHSGKPHHALQTA